MKRTPIRRTGWKRSTWITRRLSELKRKVRVKPRNPKRRQSEFARAYHSKERVEWVKSLPCCVCSTVPSDNAHVGNGGAGRKAGYESIVPLCREHHRELHNIGIQSFNERHWIWLHIVADTTQAVWLAQEAAQ